MCACHIPGEDKYLQNGMFRGDFPFPEIYNEFVVLVYIYEHHLTVVIYNHKVYTKKEMTNH